jgi:hypothetical protein
VREGRVGFSDYDNKYDLWNVNKLDGDWGKNVLFHFHSKYLSAIVTNVTQTKRIE